MGPASSDRSSCTIKLSAKLPWQLDECIEVDVQAGSRYTRTLRAGLSQTAIRSTCGRQINGNCRGVAWRGSYGRRRNRRSGSWRLGILLCRISAAASSGRSRLRRTLVSALRKGRS